MAGLDLDELLRLIQQRADIYHDREARAIFASFARARMAGRHAIGGSRVTLDYDRWVVERCLETAAEDTTRSWATRHPDQPMRMGHLRLIRREDT